MNEDNGVEIGMDDPLWDPVDPIWCSANNFPTNPWVCSLSPDHASPHHVAMGGGGRVLDRWLDLDRDLKVAAGL